MDIAGDDAGIWMTYDQLAKARDIQRDGARRLAQRHHWRRQTGNDGLARVLVPPEWLEARGDSPRDIASVKPTAVEPVTPDVASVVAALQGAIDTLRQQLIRADGREDALLAQLEQARGAAREAQEAAAELRQAEAARLARGRLARLKAAWRGG